MLNAAGRLARERDVAGVAAEARDVALHPAQRRPAGPGSRSCPCCCSGFSSAKPGSARYPNGPQPVVDGHHDHVLASPPAPRGRSRCPRRSATSRRGDRRLPAGWWRRRRRRRRSDTGSPRSRWRTRLTRPVPCGQREPGTSASRTPLQAAGGCGERQRSSPTGGAAYGIPLKDRKVGLTCPLTAPDCVPTVSETANAGALNASNSNTRPARTPAHTSANIPSRRTSPRLGSPNPPRCTLSSSCSHRLRNLQPSSEKYSQYGLLSSENRKMAIRPIPPRLRPRPRSGRPSSTRPWSRGA